MLTIDTIRYQRSKGNGSSANVTTYDEYDYTDVAVVDIAIIAVQKGKVSSSSNINCIKILFITSNGQECLKVRQNWDNKIDKKSDKVGTNCTMALKIYTVTTL